MSNIIFSVAWDKFPVRVNLLRSWGAFSAIRIFIDGAQLVRIPNHWSFFQFIAIFASSWDVRFRITACSAFPIVWGRGSLTIMIHESRTLPPQWDSEQRTLPSRGRISWIEDHNIIYLHEQCPRLNYFCLQTLMLGWFLQVEAQFTLLRVERNGGS